MEVDDNSPGLDSLFDPRRSPSPEVEVIAHNFPRKIYQDHIKIPPLSSQQPVQETVAKPRGRPRKVPSASTSTAVTAEPSASRVTRSQASKRIVKYVPKVSAVRIDSPVESDHSISRPSSPVAPSKPAPVKRGPGRPKGSKNARTASQIDDDPSHVRISIRPAVTETPATSALSGLASRLEEASEVKFLFNFKLIIILTPFLYFLAVRGLSLLSGHR